MIWRRNRLGVVELAVGMDDGGRVGPFSAPVAWLTLAASTALASVSMPIWRAASAPGSAWMRTAYLRAAVDTDLRHAVEGRDLARQQGFGIFVDRPRRQGVGAQRDEQDRQVGGVDLAEGGRLGQRLGSRRSAAEIADCTSWAAPSMLRSRLNCRVMLV